LIAAVREVGGVDELRQKAGSDVFIVEDGDRIPESAGDIGGGVRRHLFGVDDRLIAALLQNASGAEPNDAAADHGAIAQSRLRGFVGGELRGSPRERDAAATVTVIVNDDLIA